MKSDQLDEMRDQIEDLTATVSQLVEDVDYLKSEVCGRTSSEEEEGKTVMRPPP
jgi:uncharacterized protein YoxC